MLDIGGVVVELTKRLDICYVKVVVGDTHDSERRALISSKWKLRFNSILSPWPAGYKLQHVFSV